MSVIINPYAFASGPPAPFSPLDLPNLVVWLDASDAATITDAGGGAVSQWSDKSGFGNHATQAIGSLRPTTGVATQNGLNVVSFADDRLDRALTAALGDFTIFAVSTPTSATNGYVLQLHHAASAPIRQASIITGYSSTAFESYNDQEPSTTRRFTLASSASGFHVLRTVRSGSTVDGGYDGVDKAGGAWSSNTLGTLYIGGSNIGDPLQGDIAEVLVYSRALNGGEIDSVEAYLAAKWGIAP